VTIKPKKPKDLMLAPVAAEVDMNLQNLRDKSPAEIAQSLAIALNVDLAGSGPAERAARVLDEALRLVELHDWDAAIADDFTRLRLSGGSVSLDLGLSATITEYIQNGP